MKLTIPKEKIKEIAEILQLGLRAFYNVETGEIFNLPNEENEFFGGYDWYEDTIQKLDQCYDKLIEFEAMDSRESFQIMEDFAEQISDQRFQDLTFKALNRPRPFRNFKDLVEYSEYREEWFAFKQTRMNDWVQEQVDDYKQGFNSLKPGPIPIEWLDDEDEEDEVDLENDTVVEHFKTPVAAAAHLAEQFHSSDTTGHDWWHVWRVWNLAMHIAEKEGADMLTVELAALLHDMDDHKIAGADAKNFPNARKVLSRLDIDEKIVEEVIGIIKEVSFKGANVDTTPTSMEVCIVQDADRLDAIGAIGVARAFAYGGSKNRPIYNPNEKSVQHNSFEEYKSSEGSTLNHFYEKLLLLKDRLNTNTAKAIAVERHKYLEQFVERFLNEWNMRDIERSPYASGTQI